MHLFRELRRRESRGEVVRVAVVGLGSMGRGIARQIKAMPGMRPVIFVNRTVERAVECWIAMGEHEQDVVVSGDPRLLELALEQGLPCACADPEVVAALEGVDVVVESSGSVASGARAVLAAIQGRKHVVLMNAELDATLGCYLAARAREQGVVYGYADGDQPGVLMRLYEWVRGVGLEVMAAVNCKGFLDVKATPESSREWANRMQTSARMVCAFTDGTKMNLENAVVANATGLLPGCRGMHGVRTTQSAAVLDFQRILCAGGIVDYTLGGDFGGGVFVIGRSEDRARLGHYLEYLKMGSGPDYMFLRPYHLCHVETPLSVAEAVLYGEPTIAPRGAPKVEVVAVAKRDLCAGEVLDGIGGAATYGQIERVEVAGEFLPIGLSEGLRLQESVAEGNPIPRVSVEIEQEQYLWGLRKMQDTYFKCFTVE